MLSAKNFIIGTHFSVHRISKRFLRRETCPYSKTKAQITDFWTRNKQLEAEISSPNKKRLNVLPEWVSYNYNGVVKDIKVNNPTRLSDMKYQFKKKFTSSYEAKTEEFLKSKAIPFKSEVYIGVPWNFRFDFAFSFKGIPVLIEIDGEPHFNRKDFESVNKRYSGGGGCFDQYQNKDCWKTEIALIRGYKVIRVGYFHMDYIDNVFHDALEAFNSGNSLFLSHPAMYGHVLKKMQTISLLRDSAGFAFL